jgi:hypothetical protein
MSAFEADRFNHSRTSPESSFQLSAVSYQQEQIPRCARNDKRFGFVAND